MSETSPDCYDDDPPYSEELLRQLREAEHALHITHFLHDCGGSEPVYLEIPLKYEAYKILKNYYEFGKADFRYYE